MSSKRMLSLEEVKRLRKLNLSPKVEKAVREVWAKETEHKSEDQTAPVLRLFIVPIVIALFVVSITNKEWARLDNIALLFVWLVFICLPLVMGIVQACLLAEKGESLLKPVPMGIWKGSAKWEMVYGRLCIAVLMLVMAYCGHIFTAFVFMFIWVVNLCVIRILKAKVQQEIDRIEAE